MISNPHKDLVDHLLESGEQFNLVEHAECRSSVESAEARSTAGFPQAIGAKAILVKLKVRNEPDCFALFVLPGTFRLDSEAIKSSLPNVKKFRFVTKEEMKEITGGLEPGMMPPFGAPVFPQIAKLFYDNSLNDYSCVGFNAACLTKSVIMSTVSLFAAALPSKTFRFSKPKTS